MAPSGKLADLLRSGLLLVLAALADNVGDVLVALLGLLDEGRLLGLLEEGRLLGLLDLDVVVGLALGGLGRGLLALGLSVGVLQRNQFDVGVLRRFGLGFPCPGAR